MKDDRFEIRLSGAGGQGIILAGIILGEALSVYGGKHAIQTQSYGPEARGGASKAEVVVGSGEVDYPKVVKPDLLLAMTQEAYDKYGQDTKDGATVIVDSSHVRRTTTDGAQPVQVAIGEIAKETTGRTISSNVVALGVIAAVCEGLVEYDALEKAVLARVPKGSIEANKAALKAGFEAGKAAKEKG
jgi:2-oxoglutarate ferredoxin oxidoreductase subunit gamma